MNIKSLEQLKEEYETVKKVSKRRIEALTKFFLDNRHYLYYHTSKKSDSYVAEYLRIPANYFSVLKSVAKYLDDKL